MSEFVRPDGTCIFSLEAIDAAELSVLLRTIVSFLQLRDPYVRLHRYEDWWEHDGLHFHRDLLDFDRLFALVNSPKSLVESTPPDDLIFVGIAPKNNQWYLRYRVEWNDDGTSLLGECALIVEGDYPELLAEVGHLSRLTQSTSDLYYADTIL